MDTTDGITFSTMADTSEVTAEVDFETLLAIGVAVLASLFGEDVFSSPRILFPKILEARKVALDTTPNSSARPITAAALGIFFFCFFSLPVCSGWL